MNNQETIIKKVLRELFELLSSQYNEFGVSKPWGDQVSFLIVSAVNYITTAEDAVIFLNLWNEFKIEVVKNKTLGIVSFSEHTFRITDTTITNWCDTLIHPENYHSADIPQNRPTTGLERFYEESEFLFQAVRDTKAEYYSTMEVQGKEHSKYCEQLRNDEAFFRKEAAKDPRVWLMLD